MNPIIPPYVTISNFVHGRVERFKDPSDRGASAVEYAALIILAAAIIAALKASGVVDTLQTSVTAKVNELFQGGNPPAPKPTPKNS
jgi:Flp pilus assembly pilin Flp